MYFKAILDRDGAGPEKKEDDNEELESLRKEVTELKKEIKDANRGKHFISSLSIM